MTETLDQVLPAVAKAMGAVKRIAKDSRNVEQKYDFASVDDFLALVNPICADAGLVFHMNETSLAEFTRQGKYGDTHWLRMAFAITVYHSSGQSLPPVTRSVEVIRSGAQAYGSAQSYALKQFLRALLLIPTGDKDDADFQAHGEGAPQRSDTAPPKAKQPPPSDAASEAETETAVAFIKQMTSIDLLASYWKGLVADAPHVSKMPAVIAAKDGQKLALSRTADLAGDSIPY